MLYDCALVLVKEAEVEVEVNRSEDKLTNTKCTN